MSVKLANDDTVVEDTITEPEANPLSDIYAFLHQNGKHISYESAKATGDSDAKKWADAMQKATLEGHRLGALQAAAADFSMRSYHKFVDVGSSIPTESISQEVADTLDEQGIFANVHGDVMWDSAHEIEMPVSTEGERLPLIVTTNETSEATPTFEEALPILQDVFNHIEGVSFDMPDTETTNDEQESEQDEPHTRTKGGKNPITNPTWIEGVGPATVEKLTSNGYEIRATEEVFEYFESNDYADGSYDEQDLRDRFAEVKSEMAEAVKITVKSYLEQEMFEKAEGTIEAFESM